MSGPADDGGVTSAAAFFASVLRFLLDFFLSSAVRLVEDLDFFGLWFSILPSEDDVLPKSADLSLTSDFSDMLLFVFWCIVGLSSSSLTGIRRGWGGLLMCRSPSGVSATMVAGVWGTSFAGSFSLFFLPRRKSPTDGVRL